VERHVQVGGEALFGELDGGRDHVGQLHGAPALEGETETRHRAGHRHRAWTEDVGVVDHTAPGKDPSGNAFAQLIRALVSGSRRLHVEVHAEGLAAPGQMEEHGAAARQGGHEGLDHRHGDRRGHRGVYGVAATLEDGGAGLGAQRMLRHHHAPPRHRRALRHHPGRSDHAASRLNSKGWNRQVQMPASF